MNRKVVMGMMLGAFAVMGLVVLLRSPQEPSLLDTATDPRVESASRILSTDSDPRHGGGLSEGKSDAVRHPRPGVQGREASTSQDGKISWRKEASASPEAQGISSAAMAGDAAIGGRKAFAVATSDGVRVDLRPDQHGMFQRLQAQANQSIEFTLQYPGLKGDEWVDLGVLDGGSIEPEGRFKPDENGVIKFTFRTDASFGSYRIAATTSDHDSKMFDIWVGPSEEEISHEE